MRAPRRTIRLSGGRAPCGGVEEGGPLEPKLNAWSKLQALCLYSAEMTDALTSLQELYLTNTQVTGDITSLQTPWTLSLVYTLALACSP